LRKKFQVKERGMKRKLFFVILCGLCVALFAQTGASADKPAGTVSPEMEALQTAYTLAKYGYAQPSASALICAAEILVTVHTQAMNKPGGQAAAATKTEKPEYTPANLLRDAKKMVGNDSTMLAWIAKVEAASSATRAAVGGPRYQVDRVNANASVEYLLDFRASQLAEVAVSGDGDTDLDLYIYDSNGNLIAYDEGYTDDCYVSWVPRWTGTFSIVVRNRGRVYNIFQIATN